MNIRAIPEYQAFLGPLLALGGLKYKMTWARRRKFKQIVHFKVLFAQAQKIFNAFSGLIAFGLFGCYLPQKVNSSTPQEDFLACYGTFINGPGQGYPQNYRPYIGSDYCNAAISAMYQGYNLHQSATIGNNYILSRYPQFFFPAASPTEYNHDVAEMLKNPYSNQGLDPRVVEAIFD